MKIVLQLLSMLALLTLFTAPTLYLLAVIDKGAMTLWMLVATLLWFATAPLWMGRDSKA